VGVFARAGESVVAVAELNASSEEAHTRGLTSVGIAKAHGISVKTALAQLKAILTKTSTHRQAELAILLARLTAR